LKLYSEKETGTDLSKVSDRAHSEGEQTEEFREDGMWKKSVIQIPVRGEDALAMAVLVEVGSGTVSVKPMGWPTIRKASQFAVSESVQRY
jgi:hypothetical protein